MSNFDIAKKVILNTGGIVKTSDLKYAGLKNYEISNLCENNMIDRIRQGFYCLSDSTISEEQILATVLPEGIICLEAALYHYGYSDYAPLVWTIAVPRAISLSKLNINGLPIKPHFIQKQNYELGKTTDDFNGFTLNVYDRERTICDCFKYKNQLDSEIFNKAINAYIADDKKNLENLSKYAKQLKVYKKVTELIGILLNGR